MRNTSYKPNRKVKNATKTEVDGIKFDSLIESRLYGLLRLHKIPFTMKESIVLQESFRYNGTAIREIVIIPDFVVRIGEKVFYLDSKGFQTEKNVVKIKMLKHLLVKSGIQSEIHLPSTKQECEKVINMLLKVLCDSKQNT